MVDKYRNISAQIAEQISTEQIYSQLSSQDPLLASKILGINNLYLIKGLNRDLSHKYNLDKNELNILENIITALLNTK